MNDKTSYIEFTGTTAVYPETRAMEYLTLGLFGEAGELAGKLKKVIRDGETETSPLDLAQELGDCFWYLARLYALAGLTPTAGQFRDTPDAPPSVGRAPDYAGVDRWVRLLALQTGQLQLLDDPHAPLVPQLLASIYRTCDKLADALRYHTHNVLALNRFKLASRAERGTLQGSGDDR